MATQSLEVTIEWCGHAPLDPDTREIVFNGVDVTASFSYDVGSTAGCSSYATSTGTLTIPSGSSTLSALIQDTDGFVGSNDARYTLGQSLLVSLAPYNGTNQDVSKCIANCGGDVVVAYSTPAYRSLDTDRGLTLVYRDVQSHPTATITLDVKDTSTRTVAAISTRVFDSNGSLIGMVTGGPERYFHNLPGQWMRIATRFPVTSQATGAYTYTIVVKSWYTDGDTASAAVPVRVLVTNEQGSPYGGGWTIAGLYRVYPQSDGGIVLTDGSGTIQYHAGFCASAPCSFAPPLGEFSVLSKHSWGDGTLYDLRAPDGSVIAFTSDGREAYAQDRFGNRTSFTYDVSGRLETVIDPVGKVITVSSAGTSPYGGPKLTITDPASRVTTLNLNSANDLVSIVDPAGGQPFQNGSYGSGHYLTGWQDRRGGTWGVKRDCAAHVSAIASPLIIGDTLRTLMVHQDVQTTGCAGPNGNGDRAAPATASLPDSIRAIITNPRGNSTRYAVDAFGAPTRIEEPLGRTTIIQRDSMSRVTKIVETSGHVVANTWFGVNVTKTVDSTTGRTINYTYDSRYNLPLTISGNTAGVTNYLNAAGTLIDSTKVSGAVATKFKYDARGRDTLVTDPEGHVTRTRFGAGTWDNTSTIEIGTGNKTTYSYDAAGRLTLTTDALGHSAGALFDPLNRVQSTVGPRADTTRFAYDSLYLHTVTDASGNIYRYERNALGWVDSLIDPGSRVDRFMYDANGNVTMHTNRRVQTDTSSYDALDRITRLGTDAARTTTFSYDATERWIAAANAASIDTIKFDVAGRHMAEISRRLAYGLRFADTAEYNDPAGTLRRLDWDSGFDHGAVWDYDAAYQLQDILRRGQYTNFGSNNDRLAATAAFPNGVTQSNSYSVAHGLTVKSFTPSGSAADLAFQVSVHEDSLARITERYRHALPNSADTSRVYTYDAAGQLTGYTDRVSAGKTCTQGPDHGETCTMSNPQDIYHEAYTYDLVGNRTDSAGTINAGNRVASFHGYTLAYDADGNLVSKSKGGVTDSLFWNALGELVRVSRNGSDVAAFTYDGFGRRISKVASGTTTLYQWDEQHIVAERNESGNILAEYVFYPGVDRPHSITTGDSTYFFVSEPPGNIIGLLGATGSGAKSMYRYKPFGSMERNDQNVANSLRFQGRPYDAETGLYYFRARYYDPVLGRFVSEDPIGLDGGINPYVFGGNSPLSQVDPSGLSSTCPEASEAEANVLAGIVVCEKEWPFSTPKNEGVNANPSARGGAAPGTVPAGGGGSASARTGGTRLTTRACAEARVNFAVTAIGDAAFLFAGPLAALRYVATGARLAREAEIIGATSRLARTNRAAIALAGSRGAYFLAGERMSVAAGAYLSETNLELAGAQSDVSWQDFVPGLASVRALNNMNATCTP